MDRCQATSARKKKKVSLQGDRRALHDFPRKAGKKLSESFSSPLLTYAWRVQRLVKGEAEARGVKTRERFVKGIRSLRINIVPLFTDLVEYNDMTFKVEIIQVSCKMVAFVLFTPLVNHLLISQSLGKLLTFLPNCMH